MTVNEINSVIKFLGFQFRAVSERLKVIDSHCGYWLVVTEY